MKFANFFLPIVLIAVFLFAGCLKPNYQKSCQDLNGFACSQGFICRAGYYETTDASECCAEQCIDPNSPEILTQKAFTGQLNAKCETIIEGAKATALFKGAKFNLDFNQSKLRSDENYFYAFVPGLNGWVRNDKSQENILWETVRDYALTFPEKVSCAIEEFSDDLFTVSENQLIVPEI